MIVHAFIVSYKTIRAPCQGNLSKSMGNCPKLINRVSAAPIVGNIAMTYPASATPFNKRTQFLA